VNVFVAACHVGELAVCVACGAVLLQAGESPVTGWGVRVGPYAATAQNMHAYCDAAMAADGVC
jgi:hypothetical protein